MKVKLLKKIRKDYKFKFRKGFWFVLRDGRYRTTHLDFESALLEILEHKCTYYDNLFNWDGWNVINKDYIIKVNTRHFNKI